MSPVLFPSLPALAAADGGDAQRMPSPLLGPHCPLNTRARLLPRDCALDLCLVGSCSSSSCQCARTPSPARDPARMHTHALRGSHVCTHTRTRTYTSTHTTSCRLSLWAAFLTSRPTADLHHLPAPSLGRDHRAALGPVVWTVRSAASPGAFSVPCGESCGHHAPLGGSLSASCPSQHCRPT